MARTLFVTLLLAIAACHSGGGANAPGDEAQSPEAQCLSRATAPRERQPDEPGRIGVRHILVRHKDSTGGKGMGIARSRGEACMRALEALKSLEGGSSFEDAVAKYSDERGAETRGGSLGLISRDNVQSEFADAAFELKVDELSYVVETKAGFHIILRTE